MSKHTLKLILTLLKDKNIEFTHYEHEPIPKDSIGAAKVRGLSIDSGAKVIIFQGKSKKFYQVILSGHKKVNTKELKKITNEKSISLADPNDILELTDCVIGTVPPLGILFNIPVYIDKSILEKEEVVFSTGTNTDTIKTNPNNLVKANNATIIEISKEK